MVTPESFFHVAIKTTDVDRDVAFYRDHLDGEVIDRAAGRGERADDLTYAALRVADKRVYLFETAPYEAAGLVEELPPGFLHFGYVVADVDAAAADLAASGAPFVMEPTDFGPLRVAFCRSPGGTRIELLDITSEGD
jgi:catechol 2,3-dioxygenase-like lactoylglutathione lyase family enzyme